MSLIVEVARLKELEAARDSCQDRTVFAFLERLQQDAPAMLEVLGGFQPGDSEVLTGLLLANAPYGNPAREVLRRMRAMASKMEEQ
ncbi:hypothetical protein M0R72_20410 [Candidatus Pacearchaeota archaeon]|jgi:hypothetical protein|nr:hypothetical protein [Candidatus Pacearchaeota archaeon]